MFLSYIHLYLFIYLLLLQLEYIYNLLLLRELLKLQGIIVSGLTYTVQVWVVEKRGPVFTAIFSPLALILTAVFSALIFHDALYWGKLVLIKNIVSFFSILFEYIYILIKKKGKNN